MRCRPPRRLQIHRITSQRRPAKPRRTGEVRMASGQKNDHTFFTSQAKYENCPPNFNSRLGLFEPDRLWPRTFWRILALAHVFCGRLYISPSAEPFCEPRPGSGFRGVALKACARIPSTRGLKVCAYLRAPAAAPRRHAAAYLRQGA